MQIKEVENKINELHFFGNEVKVKTDTLTISGRAYFEINVFKIAFIEKKQSYNKKSLIEIKIVDGTTIIFSEIGTDIII